MPNRANVWALKELGVRRIVAPIVCGALRLDYELGDMIACDQFIDRTWGREDTYYQGPGTVLVGSARPFCEELSSVLVHTARDLGQRVHVGGTAVIVHGPRFSTTAESSFYHGMGWDIVMVTYPSAISPASWTLLREPLARHGPRRRNRRRGSGHQPDGHACHDGESRPPRRAPPGSDPEDRAPTRRRVRDRARESAIVTG
jgi:hypothetical protein